MATYLSPTLSVVIPTQNRRESLRRTLEPLDRHIYPLQVKQHHNRAAIGHRFVDLFESVVKGRDLA